MFKSLSEWVLSEKKEARSFSSLSNRLGFVSRQTLTAWASPDCVSFVNDDNLRQIAQWLSAKYPNIYKNVDAVTIRDQWNLSDASLSRSELKKSKNSKKESDLTKEIEVLLQNLVNRIDHLERQLGEIKGAIAAMSAGNELLLNRVSHVEQQLSLRGDNVFN